MNERAKAIIFVGFKFKKEAILAARELGFAPLLVTENSPTVPEGLFAEIFHLPLHDTEKVDTFCTQVRKRFLIKSVVTNYDDFVVQRSFLATKLGIPAPSLYSACCARNKVMQRHAFNFLRENIPNRIVKSEKATLRAFRALGGDVYLKAISGVKSQFVTRVRSESELHAAFAQLDRKNLDLDPGLYDAFSFFNLQFHYPDPHKTFLVEKTVTGQQLAVLSLMGSHDIWHAPSVADIYSAQDLGRDDTFLAFRILPSKHPATLVRKIHDVTSTAIHVLGMKNAAFHSEFLLTETGDLKIVEINGRVGGYRPTMYREAYGIDVSKLFIQATLNRKISARGRRRKFVSLMEIFPDRDGIFHSVSGWDTVQHDPDISYIRAQAKPGESVGQAKSGHRPVLVFLISGKTYEQVYARSVELQGKLKVQLHEKKAELPQKSSLG